jgi:hypothetical protein
LLVEGHAIAVLSGYLALVFITATAVMMFLKRKLFGGHVARNEFLSRIHIAIALLGGLFLLIHADYYLSAPITQLPVFLGYAGTGLALVVWFSGFSFLERMRYSLLYHGSLSLSAIALMVVHSLDLGFIIPFSLSEVLLAIVGVTALVQASRHIIKIVSQS